MWFNDFPRIGIVIIHGRDTVWFKDAVDSSKMNFYPDFKVHVEKNLDRKRSIGKCWNDAVNKLDDCRYLYFLGDDDFIAPDMLFTSVVTLELLKKQDPKHVQLSTYLMNVNERGDTLGLTQRIPTGLWDKQWLVDNPFDEKLKSLVDASHFNDLKSKGYINGLASHHYGYFYRQHSAQVTGRKLPDMDILEKWERKIYFDPCMSHFGDGFVDYHGFINVPIGRVATYDNMFVFGCYSDRTFKTISNSLKQIKYYWAGSDLIKYIEEWRHECDLSKKDNIKHYCGTEEQCDTLKKMGIKAKIVPLYANNIEHWEVLPLPKKPAVMYYANTTNWQLYGISNMHNMAQKFPDVDFHLVGDPGRIVNTLPNMINHGKVSHKELKEIMKKVSVYMRFTTHDAFPHLISESILSGRYVIYNHKVPYVRQVKSEDGAAVELKKLLKKMKPNDDGARAYRGFLNQWEKILED